MGVSIQGDANVREPDHLRDDLRLDALRKQEGGAGVPEVVEADVAYSRRVLANWRSASSFLPRHLA